MPESGGEFLRLSPEQDLRDIVDELPRGVREAAFGRRFALRPRTIAVIGGSFGGAAAILSVLDPRITAAVAVCPVVDWRLRSAQPSQETSNPSYTTYIRQAFGAGYRLPARNWAKLRRGRFYNPAAQVAKLKGKRLLLFHAQDDPYIPWSSVRQFSERTGARLRLLERGGHLSTAAVVDRYWRTVARFLDNSPAQNSAIRFSAK